MLDISRDDLKTIKFVVTYVGGLTMLNNSTGEVGTFRTINFLPSVDPKPTEVQEGVELDSKHNFEIWLVGVSEPNRP